MIATQNTPAFLVICIIGAVICGLIVLSRGGKAARAGIPLIWGALLMLIFGAGLGWSALSEDGFRSRSWVTGWILPRDGIGAIAVGMQQDALSVLMMGLAAFTLILLITSSPKRERRDTELEQTFGAGIIAAAGVSLAWMAVTPWLEFVGLSLTILGGFLALGSDWDTEAGASWAARFAHERSWSILLAIIGTAILGGNKLPSIWMPGTSWPPLEPLMRSDLIGGVLLVSGLFVQIQSFPFLGWVATSEENVSPVLITVSQVFPAWAAFAVLFRLETQLRSIGVFSILGWVGLCSAFLTLCSGLLQAKWSQSLRVWVSAGFSLCLAILALSGPVPAFAMLLGTSLAAFAVSTACMGGGEGQEASLVKPEPMRWLKLACFLGMAVGTGMVGSVSAGAVIRWIFDSWGQPVLMASVAVSVFIFVLLGWKTAWAAVRANEGLKASWRSLVGPLGFVLLGLGVIWTGTASGGVFVGDPDQIFSSLLKIAFDSRARVLDPSIQATAPWVYWGSVFLGIFVAYWSTGRKIEVWAQIRQGLPRFSEFLAGGYRVDWLASQGLRGINWSGTFAQKLFDEKIWEEWVPGGFGWSLRKGSKLAWDADSAISDLLSDFLRRLIEVPAKLLQLVQSGDVQWYLLFAVGSGLAILVHFLKT